MNLLATDDGLRLHTHHWPGPQPDGPGRILIVHGLGEHGGRYAHVAAALNARGWDVYSWDQRGHGHSPGPRGDIPDPEALLRDTAQAIDAVRGPGRLVLLGHSMGGATAARFVAESLSASPAAWARPVDVLVLSSPALDAGLNLGQRLALAFASRLAPHVAVANGLKAEWLSRDPAVVQAYEADPLVHDRITGALTRFILNAGRGARALAPRWRVPTLLMWAGSDRCVAPRGSLAFAAGAPPEVVTASPWPNLRHEIFNEPEQAEVLGELTGWLDRLQP